MVLPHFKLDLEPMADPAAIVLAPHVRFTVLTPQLTRIEHSPRDRFEDRATQVFWYRRQPVPEFHLERSDERITITTSHLRLDYRITPRDLAPDTLSIEVFATGRTWRFGDMGEKENLRGTARTLDQIDGPVRLERGLVSRSGWAVVNDSNSLVFDDEGWVRGREARDHTDLYLFGYGHDYKACLRDFAKVAGRTPMIPRWMLGNWWSRYWAYSQDELLELMREFRERHIPLSVCIIDMDWHITDTGNRCSGWTGYTWNRELFPDPPAALAALHDMGLHVALNLHPAEGVHPHEDQYVAMALAMGVDPESGTPVEFDLANPTYARAYFEILHHPYEEQGVDFWWIDWQQGTRSKMEGLDPLTWLNHLHFMDLGRDGRRRSVIFSRYGGLGSHRYPIGFSGDSIISWNSLGFQPRFTSTAANVAYGWWSHDIGGHWRGIEEPGLYLRWVQLGVFSPILRLHSTKNPYHERRPWGWGEDVLRFAREAMQLRHSLIPYLYSMAWRNTSQDLPVITPMYYDYPEEEAAYHCPNQYLFGSELTAAPFVTPLDRHTQLSQQSVWLPKGDWFDFMSGEHFTGGRWYSIHGGLKDIPVFARSGAIVPLGPPDARSGTGNPEELSVHVFAGASNEFELYEDDGETNGYLAGQYCLTPISVTWNEKAMSVRIGPTKGDPTLVPASRKVHVVLHGIREPQTIRLNVGGEEQRASHEYDREREALTVRSVTLRPGDEFELSVEVEAGALLSARDRRAEKMREMLRVFRLDTEVKRQLDGALAQILEEPGLLEDFGVELHDAHRAALRSIVESKSGESV